MKFANAAPSLSMKTTSTCNEILMANIIYIYISYSFRLFFSSKKVSEVRDPSPPESP